ncbi:virulence RhuM family protein [Fretibacterium fastidiosum]|uniref:Bro-N domain-containing protein n=1 Tax=Fretibacterium fastidiosum TaxID=651822 RepID=A0AB94IWE6_9BACT|nr:RhuM family protein [Fretibacterium fastidiosum]CBL28085.1 hypothetical protein SY1_07560 [Fretibacterium fastidiosum]
MADIKRDKLKIRNSTVDFLVFTKDAHEDGIEVRVQDHDVWLTQKAIAQLFDVDRSVVTKHLKNVYESGELSEDSTCANFAQVADNGKTYHYKFYSLSAIIAVGYRINSGRATQFRQWATKVLDTFTKQGYVLDKSRLINGQIFDEDYFDHLISEIQEIRASERRFYAANAARRFDPVFKEFYDRMIARGKHPKQALAAVGTKLLRVIHAVMTSQKPYNPQKLLPPSTRISQLNP